MCVCVYTMCCNYYMYNLFYLKPIKNVLPAHVVTDSYDYENTEFLQNSKPDDDGNEQYCYLLIIVMLMDDDTPMFTFYRYLSNR